MKLVKGTRFVSFLFIGCSILIAAGILFAANMYYNIDTGEIVMEEIQRTTGLIRAIGGVIVGGTATSTLPSGVAFEVRSDDDVLLSGTGQLLRFSGGHATNYVSFRAPAGLTTTTVYTWPAAYPTSTGFVLESNTAGTLNWLSLADAGLGDITAVGDCPSGDCFTSDGNQGSSLWFYQASPGPYRSQLTSATLSGNRTISLPDASGTLALGTGTSTYVAYWDGTNTLTGEAQLATSRGGTGADSSAWNGMLQVVGGSWGAVTGTAGYAAYWSDNNTVASEQYLGVGRGGTGRGSWTQWGVLYADGSTSLTNTAAGTADYILVGAGSAAPTWKDISQLLTAGSGINLSGTTNVTVNLGGTLATTTTITQGNYDMIFALTGTGDFVIVDSADDDIFRVTSDGRVLYGSDGYPIVESGKEILKEMIPVFGFDLPSQTATTSFVQLSRTIEDYPFAPAETGTSRVHKFIIRYADATTTASSSWRVWNETGSSVTDTFQVPASASTDLGKGEAYITPGVTIPINTDDWRLELQTSGDTVRVYQIFLAAYDVIQ